MERDAFDSLEVESDAISAYPSGLITAEEIIAQHGFHIDVQLSGGVSATAREDAGHAHTNAAFNIMFNKGGLSIEEVMETVTKIIELFGEFSENL